MEISAIEQLIEAGLPGSKATVTGDGRHFEAIVVSESFAGQSLIQKHRAVLATVKSQIASDALHALSVKAYTPEEWVEKRG